MLTNGANDGWNALSYQKNMNNDSVIVMTFPNGAHHSELLHYWKPNDNHDTPDIQKGHVDIVNLLNKWLQEIKEGKG